MSVNINSDYKATIKATCIASEQHLSPASLTFKYLHMLFLLPVMPLPTPHFLTLETPLVLKDSSQMLPSLNWLCHSHESHVLYYNAEFISWLLAITISKEWELTGSISEIKLYIDEQIWKHSNSKRMNLKKRSLSLIKSIGVGCFSLEVVNILKIFTPAQCQSPRWWTIISHDQPAAALG